MTTTTNNVVGIGVYVEFYKLVPGGNHTWQFIVLPEGSTPDGASARSIVFQRRITEQSPRKTWKPIPSGQSGPVSLGIVDSTLAWEDKRDSALTLMTSGLRGALDNVHRLNYKATHKPCFFEVTAEDLAASRVGKVPYKALGRIWKVRKALGYPEAFIIPNALTPSS